MSVRFRCYRARNAARALREAGFGAVELVDPAEPGFLSALSNNRPDVAFLALHGAGGEDGTIQGALEFLHIPYTGSNSIASACAVDKDLAKLLYDRAGIPISPGVALMPADEVDAATLAAIVGEESFVKPAINGSSYGVRPVHTSAELPEAIAFARSFGSKVLVERRVVGTEVTVGVLGDGETLRALPVVEICMPEQSEFYDLEVKYVDPTDIHRIPARLDAKTSCPRTGTGLPRTYRVGLLRYFTKRFYRFRRRPRYLGDEYDSRHDRNLPVPR